MMADHPPRKLPDCSAPRHSTTAGAERRDCSSPLFSAYQVERAEGPDGLWVRIIAEEWEETTHPEVPRLRPEEGGADA